MTRPDPLIEGYLDYKREVNMVTRGTVQDIRCSLNRVTRRMQQVRPDVPLWKLWFEDFLCHVELEREAEASPACINQHITHSRRLLECARRSGRADRNLLTGFRLKDGGKRTPPRSLTLEEARALIEACLRGAVEERRDRTIGLLLYGCGVRTGKLFGLNIQHVSTEHRVLSVMKAKGDKSRIVPVRDGVYTGPLAYLPDRGGKRGPLFRTRVKKRRLSIKDVGRVVRLAVKRAALPADIKLKTLRHSYATHLMDRGVDLGVTASLMGHCSPQEIGVYLHVLSSRLERAVTTLASGVES